MKWEESKTPLVDLRRIPPGRLRNEEAERLVATFPALRDMNRVIWFLGGTE